MAGPIDIKRDDLRLLLEAGYIYLAMGRFKEARDVFEGIHVLTPEHEVPVVALANVLFAQRKFLPAIRTLKEAIKLNDQSAFAHAHLGEALLFYGKKSEAIAMLDRAQQLEPKGRAGEFARSLKELIQMGYDPVQLKQAQMQAAKAQGRDSPRQGV